jgi:Domain of unknown function (DUF397)
MSTYEAVTSTGGEPGWRRSSFCWSGECVEVATADGEVFVRDSTRPYGLQRYTADEWRSFVRAVKSAELDDLTRAQ